MKGKLINALATCALLFGYSGVSFAQWLPGETPGLPGYEDQGWDMHLGQSNIWINNQFYDRHDFYYAANEGEQIEEIIVTAKRQALHRIHLDIYAQFDYVALDTYMDSRDDECATIQAADPLYVCETEIDPNDQ